MKYYLPNHEDNIIALLEHPDRIHHIDGEIMEGTQWGKVVAAMQELFPALTDLELRGFTDVPALPSGVLGGSAPCLQESPLYCFPFPEFPTFFLSARGLVFLHVHNIPPGTTGCISPEAMVAGLTELTRLQTFSIILSSLIFESPPDRLERRRRADFPMRVVLPVLNYLEVRGHGEYLEDLVAHIDAPRVNSVRTALGRLDALRFPQLTRFIGRADNLRGFGERN